MEGNLVIVESPAKAGRIQSFLGKDYIVKSSYGHIRDLQDKKLSEICTILNKNESNINSQRAHIRKKLNLQTNQNLKTVLTERLKKKPHLQQP